ncbi:MAG TPA: phasin family protein [Pseudomonadales bacterium]|nr:phasin family protein [Pseudomonadales bacterium]
MSNESRISKAIKPVSDLVVLNAETTGTILMRQNSLFGDMIAASVDQVKILSEAGSVRDALESQRAYLREMGSKVRSTTRENIETLRTAGRDAGAVVKGAFRSARKDVGESVEQAADQVSQTVQNVGDQAASYVAPQDAPSFSQAPNQFGSNA